MCAAVCVCTKERNKCVCMDACVGGIDQAVEFVNPPSKFLPSDPGTCYSEISTRWYPLTVGQDPCPTW